MSGLKKINAIPEYPFKYKNSNDAFEWESRVSSREGGWGRQQGILYIVNILSYDGVRSIIFMLNLMN